MCDEGGRGHRDRVGLSVVRVHALGCASWRRVVRLWLLGGLPCFCLFGGGGGRSGIDSVRCSCVLAALTGLFIRGLEGRGRGSSVLWCCPVYRCSGAPLLGGSGIDPDRYATLCTAHSAVAALPGGEGFAWLGWGVGVVWGGGGGLGRA